jgi:hypothetical protein
MQHVTIGCAGCRCSCSDGQHTAEPVVPAANAEVLKLLALCNTCPCRCSTGEYEGPGWLLGQRSRDFTDPLRPYEQPAKPSWAGVTRWACAAIFSLALYCCQLVPAVLAGVDAMFVCTAYAAVRSSSRKCCSRTGNESSWLGASIYPSSPATRASIAMALHNMIPV